MQRSFGQILLALLCFGLFSGAHAQSCFSLSASNDDTICQGGCTAIGASINGPVATTSYGTVQIPYAPYPFTGGNPVLVNLDDLWSPVVNIPFCFEFYGTVYNQLVVGTNGLISFDVSQANGACPWTISSPIPNAALPLNCIMAPFHDINPMTPTATGATEINWQVYGTAPCRTFVITWNDIAQFGAGCDTLTSTSQVVLHETTYFIDINIASKPLCTLWNNGYAIEGLQNATGTAATVAPGRNYPSTWAASSDAIRFRPAGAPHYTVQWLDPSNTVVSTSAVFMACPTQTTTYTVNVTFTFCSGPPVTLTDQVTVYVIPTTLAAYGVVTQPLCTGVCNGTITVTVTNGTGPFTYTWTPTYLPSTPNQTGLCPGMYYCTVRDASGCDVNLSFNLLPQMSFQVFTSGSPSVCNGNTGSAAAIINNGTYPFTYQWSTGDTTASISNLAPGPYSCIVTDSMGCIDTVPYYVSSLPFPVTATATSLLCYGDTNAVGSVTAQGGLAPYTYLWGPYGGNQSTATGLGAGMFTIFVTDVTGCLGMVSITIASPPQLIVTPASNLTICQGESAVISAAVTGGTQPYTYNWSHSLPSQASNTITPTMTDTYTIQVTDANGCTSPQQSMQVKVEPLPVADFYSLEPGCPPAVVPFFNLTDSAVSYQWNFGDPSSGAADTSWLTDPTHIYFSSGIYNVTLIATNIWGCSDTITLPTAPGPVAPLAQVDATVDEMTINNASTSFMNYSSGASSYCIFFGDGDSLCTSDIGPYPHTYDSTGTFHIMLVAWNSDGCPDTAWTDVVVEEPTTCYIPNAFTPNGSGVNDQFMVYGLNVDLFELRVYDRWGMLLFSTTDIYHGWDGTYEGHKCQEDVYVWKLTYVDNFGELNERYGHVSLIR